MLVERIKKFFLEYKEPRFRDRRAFYASELMKDARDLYWGLTGERETNPTDTIGLVRMFMGKAIEEALVKNVFSNLHWFGLHMYGAGGQIPIGLSAPIKADGYLDALLVERIVEGFGIPYVLEVKTKSGYGADLLCQNPDPGPSYLAQMGLYLMDLSAKKVTSKGLFLFFILSDKNVGEMIEIECDYNETTGIVRAHTARYLTGETRAIDYSLDMKAVMARLKTIELAVEKKILPPADKQYKYPLTAELIASLSEKDLEKALAGAKIIGDWEIRYSRFFDKHLEAQGTSREYTEDERALLANEWAQRHPRSKKFKQSA